MKLFPILASIGFAIVYTVDTTIIKPFGTYVCTERIFDSPPFMCNNFFFEKTVIKVRNSHLYASCGTFYVQIGQLFEAQ